MRFILQINLLLVIIVILSLGTVYASAEENVSKVEKVSVKDNSPSMIEETYEFKGIRTDNVINPNPQNNLRLKLMDNERFYVIVLAIMFLVSLITTLLLSSSSRTSKDIITISGLNLVVFGSMISVLVVDTSEALGAIMGILGSMGGYLFGSWDKREKE